MNYLSIRLRESESLFESNCETSSTNHIESEEYHDS